jgi:hypothetical protein
MDGLPVRDGRLMNNRPDSVMGITAAAIARKEMKRERKIEMQAEAYVRGERMVEAEEMMKNFML